MYKHLRKQLNHYSQDSKVISVSQEPRPKYTSEGPVVCSFLTFSLILSSPTSTFYHDLPVSCILLAPTYIYLSPTSMSSPLPPLPLPFFSNPPYTYFLTLPSSPLSLSSPVGHPVSVCTASSRYLPRVCSDPPRPPLNNP